MKRIGKNETTEINTVKKCFVALEAALYLLFLALDAFSTGGDGVKYLTIVVCLLAAAWVLLSALGMGTALNLLAALYFVNFLVNAFQSLTLRSERLFAAGLWLFLLCDVCVGLRNQPSLLPGLAGAAQVGMWLFYLPGQVLLVLSGFPKRRENTT